jgi:diaminopimelate epimerase
MKFCKYSSTGNDFLIFDNRLREIDQNPSLWKKICARRTGVGADGVIFLEDSITADFKMNYINADGHAVSMCGNGLRAISTFALNDLKLTNANGEFCIETNAGLFIAHIQKDKSIAVEMNHNTEENAHSSGDVFQNKDCIGSYYINTGVPHCVYELSSQRALEELDVEKVGRRIRYDSLFENGVNSNFYFVKNLEEPQIVMRTYERGVEAETLSCGTGTVAVAMSFIRKYSLKKSISFETAGGPLSVEMKDKGSLILLSGGVVKVYDAEINLDKFS